MKDIYEIKLIDLIPESIKKDEQVISAAKALDNELQTINEILKKLVLLKNIDQLPEEFVDLLAWQRHVDFYKPDLPIETKIDLVKKSKSFHKRKGTPAAVEDLVIAIFGDGQVEEWFEYGGLPYHFRVLTTNPSATNEQAQEFINAVKSVKRLSAVLDEVLLIMTDDMNLYFGGALYMGDKLTIEQVV